MQGDAPRSSHPAARLDCPACRGGLHVPNTMPMHAYRLELCATHNSALTVRELTRAIVYREANDHEYLGDEYLDNLRELRRLEMLLEEP